MNATEAASQTGVTPDRRIMDTETIALLKLVRGLAQEISGAGTFETPEHERRARAYICERAELIKANVNLALAEAMIPCGDQKEDA